MITITVTFSENVNVTGIPQLFLNVGSGVYASYVSGSGSNTLVFQYTVQSGDTTNGNDLNYANIDALVLPSGASIADAAGNTPPGGTTTSYNGGITLNYVTLPPVDSNISLAGTSDVKIDSNAASVSFGAGGTGSGNEPNSGSSNFSIPITLSSAATQNITLTYTISSSSTSSSNDYSGLTGTLSIPQGSTSASIDFSILADGIYEGTETIVLEITGVTGGAIGSQNTFTFTINDAQTKPTLSFTAGASNTVTENVSGGNYSASLTLSGPTQSPVTFVVNTTGGTATAGSDYTAISNQTFTIPAGQTSFSFSIGIIDDSIYDPSETFQIQLSSISANANFQGGGSTLVQTVTISDDDTPTMPTLSFTSGANANVNENAGTYSLSFTLSTTYISDVTFTVTTSNGTVTAGSDYTAVNQTVTISAGQTTATVNIPISNDTVVEGTETFTVTISGVSNANVSGTTQTVSILDDDLGIVSATTMDIDGDGKIDTYKIVFTSAVTDSSFDPSKWTISGYTGIAINTAGTVGGETNTANDNTIYISFNEKTTPDTGAKPDVTVSSGGINGTGGQVLVAHNTASITEIDGAKPVLLSVEGTAGATTLTLTFSEPVYGGTVASCTGTSGNVQTSHLVYNNVSSGGATAIGAVTDSCSEPDNVIVVTTTGTIAMTDSGQDSIGGTSSLTDAAGNTLANTKTLSISSGIQPYIKTVELYDLDGDGNVDTLRAYFRDSTNSTNVDMSDSTLTNLSQFSANGSAPSSVNTGTTANDHIVNFSVNNITGTGPNVLTSFSYTRSGTDSWLSTGAAQLASFSSGYTVVDKAPPVIKSVTATDGTNDKMTIVFSEDIPASIRTAITAGTVGNYLILKNGNDQTISFPSIASVTWTANNTLEITFSGDVSSTITDGSSITLSNSSQIQDAAGNFTVSTATMVGTFTTDLTPPYLTLVSDVTPASNYSGSTGTSTILVEFSEGMKSDGGTNAANRIANYTLVPSAGGSPITISSITVVSPDVYQLNLSTRLTSGTEYKLTVGTSTQDLAGNSITNPRELTFVANDILRVLSAEALSSTSVKVTFSRLIDNSSASCSGARLVLQNISLIQV